MRAFLDAILNITGDFCSSSTGTPKSLIVGISPSVAPDTTKVPPYGRINVGSVGLADLIGPKYFEVLSRKMQENESFHPQLKFHVQNLLPASLIEVLH